MAINVMQGLMGAGKSYVAVNRFMPDFLLNTNRPIYTNLPLEVDKFLLWLAPKNPVLREQLRARIFFLEDKDKEAFDEEGKSLGTFHGVREFWYFTQPNAVVFLDEVADIYDATNHRSRPVTLGSYINHHRHYKDDLFFFCQDRDDIDVKIRRKIQYVWTVRNSTKENMFGQVRWLRGLKWPVQFFFVKCYLGTDVLKLDARQIREVTTEQGFLVWPKSRGFKNYRSFSASQSLPGKKLASDSQQSTDCDPSIWNKVKGVLPSLGLLGMLVIAGLVGAAVVGRSVFGLLRIDSSDVARTGLIGASAKAPTIVEDQEDNPRAGTNFLAAVGPPVPAVPAVGGTNEIVPIPAPDVERLVLVTSGRAVTMKGKKKNVYVSGSKIGSNTVAHIFLEGVRFSSGRVETWDVLFPGE
jgi:hypothetical protein